MNKTHPEIRLQKAGDLALADKIELYSELNSRLLNLFYTISHNLNTYTANIDMLLDVIEIENDPAEIKIALGHLRTVSNGLNQTIHDLSRVIDLQDVANVAKESLDLNAYISKVEQVVNGCGNQAKALFINKVPGDAFVFFNPAYLESLLLNFSTNAIKYAHPQRFPVIEFDFSTVGGQQVLAIKDNGLGIDLEQYGDSLFGLYQTFHQHENANGFGLYITKYQVESMKGKIEVSSVVGEGTTFRILFSK